MNCRAPPCGKAAAAGAGGTSGTAVYRGRYTLAGIAEIEQLRRRREQAECRRRTRSQQPSEARSTRQASAASRARRDAPNRRALEMRVLVLGGTQFVGRAIVDALLASGHSVTLTNRGQSEPTASDLWGEKVQFIAADRLAAAGTAVDEAGHTKATGDLQELAGQTWDVAIDVNCYLPLAALKSTAALQATVGFYCFISTVSVYDVGHERFSAASTPDGLAALSAAGGLREDAPLLQFSGKADPYAIASQRGSDEELGENSYGALKVLCEEIVKDAYGPAGTLIIRPGIVAGAFDPSGRLSYWPKRVSRGGTTLAPPADAALQFIDAVDLGEWTVRMCESRTSGVFNAVGTQTKGLADRPTFGDVLATCLTLADVEQTRQAIAGSGDLSAGPVEVVHASAEFLSEQGVATFTDLPLWTGALTAENASSQLLFMMSNEAAVHEGLTFRPRDQTLLGALQHGAENKGAWGLPESMEQALVAATRVASPPAKL